jgi:hypothetical protein
MLQASKLRGSAYIGLGNCSSDGLDYADPDLVLLDEG